MEAPVLLQSRGIPDKMPRTKSSAVYGLHRDTGRVGMNIRSLQELLARRVFLSRVGTGVSLAGATLAGTSTIMAQNTGEGRWQPGRHAQDDWFDKIPGQHRFLF